MSETKGRVLCVDDEPHVLRALRWLLQAEFEVHTATSAAEGLQLLPKHDFDVVVSDQRMPEVTGVEFLADVRRRAPRAMRILLTGYADLDAMVKSVNESEVYRFITKPWDIKELPRLIGEAAAVARSEAAAPRATAPVASPAQQCTTVAMHQSESILLVDDDPEVHKAVDLACGNAIQVRHAYNLGDAVRILKDNPVGVIVSEVQVGKLDATRLVRLMKVKHPETVSVVFSDQKDAEVVMTLINHGQVFRFIPKPLKQGFIRIVLEAALKRHRELLASPAMARRARPEPLAPEMAAALLRDVRQATGSLAPVAAATGAGGVTADGTAGVGARLTAGLNRLLSR